MALVLVIEDEEMLRSSMTRGISKLPGVDVVDAGSLEDALALIDQNPPDVIVSDIDLPRRSGLELIGELGVRALRVPVIFASGYLKAFRSQIPQHADVDVMEKPVSLEELRDAVLRRVRQSQSALAASPFSLVDYIQLACMGKRSALLEVSRRGHCVGAVSVWHGDVVSAWDDQGAGEEALRRLAFSSDVTTLCGSLTEEPAAQNIEGNWEWLLMEAARLEDEQDTGDLLPGLDVDDIGDAPSEPEPKRSPADVAFDETWDHAVEALLRKDYQEAMYALLAAERMRPQEPKVQANLKRLRELGVEAPQEASTRTGSD